jgi:inner membrane protein
MGTLKEFLRPDLVWFLIGVILLAMEIVVPGFVTMFFGIGACVVGMVCLFTDISINVQLLIFIVASLLSLIVLRKWLQGIFKGYFKTKQDSDLDNKEFIGERVLVVQAISPKQRGKVELHGTNWQAQADTDIPKGATVEIIEKENLTLKVKQI